VGSPQFQDLLKNGEKSPYKDFFIDWNKFWEGNGTLNAEGIMVPNPEHLQKLFMRKPGLPILKVRFPDGSERPYWNTFYQQVDYHRITEAELSSIKNLNPTNYSAVLDSINTAIAAKSKIGDLKLGLSAKLEAQIIDLVESKRTYLGQMDLNARDEAVWRFYEETFSALKSYGGTLIRLDAFAYLHKEPGMVNFFNKPETWNYLARLRDLAAKHSLAILPEIHSEYGKGLHAEVSNQGYPIYDFFFPGLVLHAIEFGATQPLLKWVQEIQASGMRTINMLGCHDGIPVLDLKGSTRDGTVHALLDDSEIDKVVETILERGGRVKNLYGPDGKKIAYYQVNATFFSALGEDPRKLLLARAIQICMPGIPQVWYLDLFAGKNNYLAADSSGAASHKEINRTTISNEEVAAGLNSPLVCRQLELLKLRNCSPAFTGTLRLRVPAESELEFEWKHPTHSVLLRANLKTHNFVLHHTGPGINQTISNLEK
jgi:sucrose phosphorylase